MAKAHDQISPNLATVQASLTCEISLTFHSLAVALAPAWLQGSVVPPLVVPLRSFCRTVMLHQGKCPLDREPLTAPVLLTVVTWPIVGIQRRVLRIAEIK